jgi:hypothetical protein
VKITQLSLSFFLSFPIPHAQTQFERTHHWSPLKEEVSFIRTSRDHDIASFDCAKDRHVIPWVDVNARFGFIKYNRNPASIPDEDDDCLK